MAKIGDIVTSTSIGRRDGYHKLIWHACVDCGKERWVSLVKALPANLRCYSCKSKGILNHKWKKDVKIKTSLGYIIIKLSLNDFFRPTAHKDGYIPEHRLVMAKHLGRNLHSWEIVHHKNHVKDDNRIENLQLVSDDRHKQISIMEIKIQRLETKVNEQGKLIKLLQWQIKERRLEVKNDL